METTGFEPVTFRMRSGHSTTELRPRYTNYEIKLIFIQNLTLRRITIGKII